MNYSNMIEEKHLKKGFIVATLISTIVGTFTASMTLHDKIQERIDKKKQQGIDGSQNIEIKQLKEQVAALIGGGGGSGGAKDEKAEGGDQSGEHKKSPAADDKKSQAEGGKKSEPNADANKSQAGGDEKSQAGGEKKSQAGGEKKSQTANDAKSQDARSRASSNSSRRRRRRRDSLDADQDFARLANQSKNVIEQTFKDNVQRLGPEYAEGDLTTVNALQSQILEQQKTVIGILQNAVNEGRELTEDDKRRLIAAQNAATDGSLHALQGQYERMAADKKAAKSVAPPTLANTAPAPAEAPVHKPWESDPLPPPTEDRQRSSNYTRNAAIAGGIAAAAGAGAYAANRNRDRQADRAYSDDGPPRRRPAPDERRRSSLRPSEPPLPPSEDGRSRMRRREYSPPCWDDRRSSAKPRDRQRSPYDDRRSTFTRPGRPRSPLGDRRSSYRPREQDQEFVPRKSSSDQTAARTRPPEERRSSMKPRDLDPIPARPKSVAPNTAAPTAKATTMLPAELPAAAKSGAPKSPAPTAKATTIPPAKPAGGAIKETAAKQQDEAIRPSAVESPRSSNHPSQQSRHSVRGSPPPPKSKMKALPAPEAPLFCRYAQDLQKHGLPLHKTFKPGGPHCCPSCNLIIPVDTRDIWVFSTHIPPQKKGDKAKTRDYRMDSRFVVKCHDGQGKFACVLCDTNRDLDCICKNVDSLVKHLGSSHTFEEFDKDPDLVKMKNGSVVEMKGGQEVLLA